MDLRRADAQIRSHLRHRRTGPVVA
jgi:hypothetical protein